MLVLSNYDIENQWFQIQICKDWKQIFGQDLAGSSEANGRDTKTCLGQVFNYKLGCFDDVHILIYVDSRPHLWLKTRPRFSPVN
jgi:hypothetical protein